MSFFEVKRLPVQEVLPGIELRSVNLENVMMSFVDYAAGSEVPTHEHRHEQITYVLEGTLEVAVGDERRLLGPGQGVRIPPYTDHSSRPVQGPAKALDAWSPVPHRLKVEAPTALGEEVPVEDEGA